MGAGHFIGRTQPPQPDQAPASPTAGGDSALGLRALVCSERHLKLPLVVGAPEVTVVTVLEGTLAKQGGRGRETPRGRALPGSQ